MMDEWRRKIWSLDRADGWRGSFCRRNWEIWDWDGHSPLDLRQVYPTVLRRRRCTRDNEQEKRFGWQAVFLALLSEDGR